MKYLGFKPKELGFDLRIGTRDSNLWRQGFGSEARDSLYDLPITAWKEPCELTDHRSRAQYIIPEINNTEGLETIPL